MRPARCLLDGASSAANIIDGGSGHSKAVGFETPATGESSSISNEHHCTGAAGHALTFCPQPGKRPGWRGVPNFKAKASGGDLGRLHVQDSGGARDRDRPGLDGLRELAHEVDLQEPVRQARALDHDMVGELGVTSKVRSAMPL